MKNEERRSDTRGKIALGGLIVKAGLREADKAFLLGWLLAGARIAKDSNLYASCLAEGREAFKRTKDTSSPEDASHENRSPEA